MVGSQKIIINQEVLLNWKALLHVLNLSTRNQNFEVVSDVMVRRQSRQVCRKLKAIMKEDKKRTFEREHEAIINHLQVLSKSGEGVTLVEMVQKSNTFGEFGIHCQLNARKLTAVCNTDCLLYYITPKNLQGISKSFPQINDFIAMRTLQYAISEKAKKLYSKYDGLEDAMKNIHHGFVHNEHIELEVTVKEQCFFASMNFDGTCLECVKGPQTLLVSRQVWNPIFKQ